MGDNASTVVVNKVRATVSKLSSNVLAHRFRSVPSCNGERDLRRVSKLLLYILARGDRLVHRSHAVVSVAREEYLSILRNGVSTR
jgi:hypothetical protein